MPYAIHAALHVLEVHSAYDRERAAIVGKVPDSPRLVVAGRAPAQQPPTHTAGKIAEVGNRIGRKRRENTPARVRTHSHDTPGGTDKIPAGPSEGIGVVIAHRLILSHYSPAYPASS